MRAVKVNKNSKVVDQKSKTMKSKMIKHCRVERNHCVGLVCYYEQTFSHQVVK